MLLLAVAALAVARVAFYSPVPRVQVTPALSPFPTNAIPWTHRLLAHAGPWAARLRSFVKGPPKTYRMDFVAFGFTNPPQALAAQMNLGRPIAVTNGFFIWSVSPAPCPALAVLAKASAGSPFVDTPSSEVAFGGFAGEAWTLCYAERLHDRALDLQLTVHKYSSFSAQDESFTAIRALLPKGSALFLAPTNPSPIFTGAGFLPHSGLLVSGFVTDDRGNSIVY